jgi:uncharacterized protein
MRINVKAKTRSKKPGIEKIDDSNYVVAVKEVAEKGDANYAIVRALAEYFHVRLTQVRLMSGVTSRQKIFDILTEE